MVRLWSCHDFLTRVVNCLKSEIEEDIYVLLQEDLFNNCDMRLSEWLSQERLYMLAHKAIDSRRLLAVLRLCLEEVIRRSDIWDADVVLKAKELLGWFRRKVRIRVRYRGEPVPFTLILCSKSGDRKLCLRSELEAIELHISREEYNVSVEASTEDGIAKRKLTLDMFKDELTIDLNEDDIVEPNFYEIPVEIATGEGVQLNEHFLDLLLKHIRLVLVDELGNVLSEAHVNENRVAKLRKPDAIFDGRLFVRAHLRLNGDEGRRLASILEAGGCRFEYGEIEINPAEVRQRSCTVFVKQRVVNRLRLRFSDTEAYRCCKQEDKILLEEGIVRYGYAKSRVRVSEWLGVDKGFAYSALGSDHTLYEHQLKALKLLEEGKDVLVCAPNGSGKTEIVMLYALKKFMENPEGAAVLAIYPTKALTGDQEKRWSKFFIVANDFRLLKLPALVVKLDRDTVEEARERIKTANKYKSPLIILSNPAFILSTLQNGKLYDYLENRRILLIVVDEIHYYTSKDLSLLIKMLDYIVKCEEDLLGKAGPRMAFLSATVGNPEAFSREIRKALDKEIVAIGADYGKHRRGTQHVYVVKADSEAEAEKVVLNYLRELVIKGGKDIEKTLVFVPSRNLAERLMKSLSEGVAKHYSDLVQCHLGDMSLEEREEVEEDFRRGKTRILFTVKTLEVGIDIGDVQRVIHLGIPHSLNDFIQREGRIGRRGGDSESIIIVLNEAERKRVEEYIKYIRGLSVVSEAIHVPVVKTDSLLIKRIDEWLKRRWGSLKFPKEVKLTKDLTITVKFYSQSGKEFIVRGAKARKSVRAQDVVYRYLPGSIRIVKGINYIVENITKSDTKRKRYYVWLVRAGIRSFDRIWGLSLLHDAKIYYRGLKDLIKRGNLFTVSDIDKIFKVYWSLADDLLIVKVVEIPLGVKLVHRFIEEEYDPVTRERVKRIRFRCIANKPLPKELREELRLETVSRGKLIELRISKDSPLLSVLRETLAHYGDMLEKHYKEIDREFYEKTANVIWLSRRVVEEYVHLATHLILNLISEVHRWRQEEIYHDVEVRLERDEAELLKALYEILNVKKEVDVPLRIRVLFANEVDLVRDVNWFKVYKRLKGYKEMLEEDKLEACRDIIANCYAFRCFVTPYALEQLLEETRENGNRVKELVRRVAVILMLAEAIVKRVLDNACVGT
ncbi:MAG: hypothetical protein DRJ67_04370 [Thermoprotei archaeon]|nr:MAG: hypothetical protein DRJ67_04370 [Thermoprotei archaeon]